MRYAALATASAAVLAILTLPRDGRSEAASLAAQTAPSQTAPTAQRAATQEDFRWNGRIARGDEIEIRGLLGNVRAEAASGDQVEVVGRRSGDGADRVRIEVVETDDGITICTIYPMRERRRDGDENRRSRRSANDDNPCNDGHSGDIDADDARIDFTVRVPAGVRLAASTVQGNIEALGLRSPVDAASVSGNVRVSTTESARAATVSGNVDATLGRTDGDALNFASVSGDVVVRLAGDVGARVDAHTLSGDIQSDFDLRIRPGGAGDDDDDGGLRIEIGRQASGTIGRGGPELSLNTVSGNIRVLRGR
jgi:hypothetical protein